MHILILNWRDPKNPLSGGAEYVTMQHAKAWVKKGNTVTWFTSSFKKAKYIQHRDGVQFIRKGNAYTVHLHAAWYYLFSKEKFDVVIDEIHGIPFFTPLYVRKSKIIAFIHEVAGDIWDYMYPFPFNKIGKFVERIYFSFYKHIPFWTDANSTIDELVTMGIPRKNCVAIACPISNKVIAYIPKKENNPTYIFVSRLVKMKGIENILQTFSIIAKKQKNAQLWIVGGGNKKYVAYLYKLSKKLGITDQTILWGKVSEQKKLELLRKAHLLLHASVKEGWGLVILEAASQATPSVVYNVAGLKDSVKNNKTGIIVKENMPNKLAQVAINLFVNSEKYKKLQKESLKWAKSLTWEDITKESLQLLKTV